MTSSAEISPATSAATIASVTPPRARNSTIIAWTLALLFVVAAAELNIITITWARLTPSPGLQPTTVLALALGFAESGLLVLVCGLGRQHFAWRAWLFTISAVGPGWFVHRAIPTNSSGFLIALFFLHATLILVSTWVWQARGWRLVLAHEQSPKHKSRWQFSVANLFAVTTCAAFIFGLFRYLPLTWDEFVSPLPIFVCTAAISSMAAYLVLTCQRFLLVVLGAFATMLAATCLWHAWAGLNDFASGFFLMLLTSLLVLAGLYIARLAGYRLVKD